MLRPPSASKRSTRCEPINPAPPVTRMLLSTAIDFTWTTGQMRVGLIQKPLLDMKTMQYLLEEPLVGKVLEIIGGLELIHYRQSDPPCHPKPLPVGQVPAAAQKCLDDLDFAFGQKTDVGLDLGRFLNACKSCIGQTI